MEIVCKKAVNSNTWLVIASDKRGHVILGTGKDEQAARDSANAKVSLENLANMHLNYYACSEKPKS